MVHTSLRTQVWLPNGHGKSQACGDCYRQHWGSGDRCIPGVLWPSGLAKSVSSRFSEKSCLRNQNEKQSFSFHMGAHLCGMHSHSCPGEAETIVQRDPGSTRDSVLKHKLKHNRKKEQTSTSGLTHTYTCTHAIENTHTYGHIHTQRGKMQTYTAYTQRE